MSRPRNTIITLMQRLQKIKAAGLTPAEAQPANADASENLQQRIEKMLAILQTAPVKATTMTFLILYDIEDDKVRKEVAKYLKSKGSVRIQKSVFIASAEYAVYEQMHKDLQAVQQFYENQDSIILVPFNTTDARSMKIIGRDVQINTIINKPNAIFF